MYINKYILNVDSNKLSTFFKID